MIDDPHLDAIGFFKRMTHPTEGELVVPDVPVRFARTPASIDRLPPRLGEHGREILHEAGLRPTRSMRWRQQAAWCCRRRQGGVNRVRRMEKYQDILFEVRDGVARITINRPAKYNAFTAETCEELIDAFRRAGADRSVAVIVLGGAGDKAFCTGADQSAHEGAYEGRGTIGLPIDELQSLIRDVPVPVIARVQGFAIGGGNVLATLCDLTIASENAVFGQVGPKVGSVDPGFGTAYLSRLVGEKRAREIWYLCRRYTAKQA